MSRSLSDTVRIAHRRAHGGPFETCRDPICAAVEEWVYHRERPPARRVTDDDLERMVRG